MVLRVGDTYQIDGQEAHLAHIEKGEATFLTLDGGSLHLVRPPAPPRPRVTAAERARIYAFADNLVDDPEQVDIAEMIVGIENEFHISRQRALSAAAKAIRKRRGQIIRQG